MYKKNLVKIYIVCKTKEKLKSFDCLVWEGEANLVLRDPDWKIIVGKIWQYFWKGFGSSQISWEFGSYQLIWKLSAHAGIFRAFGSLEIWKLRRIQIIWKLGCVENLRKFSGGAKKFGNSERKDISRLVLDYGSATGNDDKWSVICNISVYK